MAVGSGTLLAHGRRTVAAALRASGNQQATTWSLVHQVLTRARWSPVAVSDHRLLLIVESGVLAGACVDRVSDDMLERRWIVMAVVVSLPWTKQRWAVPCVCVLATTPDVRAQLGTRHTTIAMWASLVRRWLPDRDLRLMRDPASRGLELGWHAHVQQVTLITTGRLDAVLHKPPPERTAQTMGRPGVKGSRLPALEQVLPDPATSWQTLTLEWSGEGERPVQRCSGAALWDRWGDDP